MTLDQIAELEMTGISESAYASLECYGRDFESHIQRTGSVREFSGLSLPRFVPFDLDADGNLNRAVGEAIHLIESLYAAHDVPLEGIRTYFSGSKGIHVTLPTPLFGGFLPSHRTSEHIRQVALKISKAACPSENSCLDRTIYGRFRLFRLVNSRHRDTLLYKVPLSVDELRAGPQKILELAVRPRPIDGWDDAEFSANEFLSEIREQVLPEPCHFSDFAATHAVVLPKAISRKICLNRIYGDGVREGKRHEAALRLGSKLLAAHDGDRQKVGEIMQSWNQRNKPPLAIQEIERIAAQKISEEFDYGCTDPLLESLCEPEKCEWRPAALNRHHYFSPSLLKPIAARKSFKSKPPAHWDRDDLLLFAFCKTVFANSGDYPPGTIQFKPPREVKRWVRDAVIRDFLSPFPGKSRKSGLYFWNLEKI